MVEIVPSFKHALLEEAHGVYKLEVFKPTQRDSGKYVCRATNKIAEEEMVHNVHFIGKPLNFHIHGVQSLNSAYLKEKEHAARQAMEDALKTDEYPRPPKPPPEVPEWARNKLHVATQLRDRTATVGGKVKLIVSVVGPDPDIRWLKDDKVLEYGSHVKGLTSEGVSTLELEKLTLESKGEYKCEAKNEGSTVSTSFYLKVVEARVKGDKEPPLFTLSLRGNLHL